MMKPLKYILFFCLLTGFLMSFKAPEKSPVAQNGHLKVIGTQLSNEKGQPVVLNGISLGWHCFQPRFYTKSTVKWLATDWNVNVVRAAMGVGVEDCYLQNPEFAKKCVENVVKGAVESGVYVIIDFHSHKLHTTEAKAFFTEMATKYKNVPNVIYEIWNEPDYFSWKVVKEYSSQIVSTIRSIDSDNIILVGSPHWNQDIDSVAADPLLGQKNIMYTMHFYAGTHKKWLRDRTDNAISKGIPIFISECAGMDATGDGQIDEAEWKAYLEWMKKSKLSWVAWSLSDKNETCSMLLPRANISKWRNDEIKLWGKITKESIKN